MCDWLDQEKLIKPLSDLALRRCHFDAGDEFVRLLKMLKTTSGDMQDELFGEQ